MSRRFAAALVAPLLLAAASRAFSQDAGTPAPAPAAEVVEQLSFEEAVSRAVTRNPSVGEASQAILQAQALLDRTRTVFYPLVYGDVGTAILDDARGFNGSVVTPQTQTRFSATVSYALLDAVRWANRSQARDRVRSSQIAADQTRQQVAVAAASAYLAVIAAERQLGITERNLETARALEEYARPPRGRPGEPAQPRPLAAAAGERRGPGRDRAACGAPRAGGARCRRLRERPGRRARRADAEPAQPPASDAWLQARPDVRLFTSELDARDRIVKDAWKSWLPTVTGSFTPLYVTPNGLFEPSRSWRAFFSLQVPIFDGTLGADRAFKLAERDAARFRLAGTVSEARSEMRVAQEAVARAERFVAATGQAAENAREALRITEIAYRAGATTNIEVVQAQQTARQVEIEAAIGEDRLRQSRLDLLVALGLFP